MGVVPGSSQPGDAPGKGARPTATAPASGPVWARSYAKRTPRLSPETIVAAAIAIADKEGIQAVSIRRVATHLGVRAMSLYTHIARKEDLLDLMVDEIAAETLFTGPLPEDWREAITSIAHRERQAVLRHPWTVDLRAQRPRLGPNGLKHIEQSLAALQSLELDALAKWRIATAIDEYVLGHAVSEVLERETPRREGASSTELQSLMRPYLQSLVETGDFPNLAPIIENGLPTDENNFDYGLKWMLDGIERQFVEQTIAPSA